MTTNNELAARLETILLRIEENDRKHDDRSKKNEEIVAGVIGQVAMATQRVDAMESSVKELTTKIPDLNGHTETLKAFARILAKHPNIVEDITLSARKKEDNQATLRTLNRLFLAPLRRAKVLAFLALLMGGFAFVWGENIYSLVYHLLVK